MKICNKCKKELELIFFSKNSYSCKECVAAYDKKYRLINKEKIAKRMLNYYLKNKELLSNKNKNYISNNKNIIIQKKKEYYLSHKKEIIEKQNIKERNRRKSDLAFRLKKNISCNIRYYIKKNNGSKFSKSSSKYLPFSIQELKNHLEKQFEPWMTWENHGNYLPKLWDDNDESTWTWQIDHIIPQSNFTYSSMEDEDFKKCWALENLRPLSSKTNWLEGIFRTRH